MDSSWLSEPCFPDRLAGFSGRKNAYQPHTAILILAISPILGYEGAGWKGSGLDVMAGDSSRTGTTRPGSKLRSMNVIKSTQLWKHH
jgi:hypothetical protein